MNYLLNMKVQKNVKSLVKHKILLNFAARLQKKEEQQWEQ